MEPLIRPAEPLIRPATPPVMSSCGRPRPLAPALLVDAPGYGTLAAVRDLGRRGVPVTVATERRLAAARWSRHARRTVRCPPIRDETRFVAWLQAFGSRHPGHVFCPTSDDAARLASANRASLEPALRVYAPPLDALATLLDPPRLADAARAAGLEVAPVERRGAAADLPPGRTRQAAPGRIVAVSGFVDQTGALFATLGSEARTGHTRAIGSGVILEAAPVDGAIADGLRRLFRAVGFFGVFEAVFVADGARRLLVEVRAGFSDHLAFEVDRGLALPWMAYTAAIGNLPALREAMRLARDARPAPGCIYVHRLAVDLVLLARVLSGAMTLEARRRWRRWIRAHAGNVTDPASVRADPLPAIADLVAHLSSLLRHPRAFLRALSEAGPAVEPT